MTAWHIRYGGRGVRLSWPVENTSVCLDAQLQRGSSSEVAAMIEGVLRHCTAMAVEHPDVESHGQSAAAFACSHLVGFDLLPRLQAMASPTLSRPQPGPVDASPNRQPMLTPPIHWALIRPQDDDLITDATALRVGTAAPASRRRRLTRTNGQPPTDRALVARGNAIKTTWLARALHEAGLRRAMHEGLHGVANWHSATGFIVSGTRGEMATNRLDAQAWSVLSRHLLHACLVSINTLMRQDILAAPAWMGRMTAEDLRAWSPVVSTHVNPDGTCERARTSRLPRAACGEAPSALG
jgi:TnpA family transposase